MNLCIFNQGRLNWNLPKHVVRFNFSTLANSSRVQVQVFPPDAAITIPFLTATFQPVRWTPSFPFSSNPVVFQPPVPASGKPGEEEVCGTEKWVRTAMRVACKKAKLCSVGVQQPALDGPESDVAKWWPKVNAWKIGLCMEDTAFHLGPGEPF